MSSSKTTRELFNKRITDPEEYTTLLYQLADNLNTDMLTWSPIEINPPAIYSTIITNPFSLSFAVNEGKYALSIMGGILYFLIYYEALASGIIKPDDISQDFLKLNTVDIDLDLNMNCQNGQLELIDSMCGVMNDIDNLDFPSVNTNIANTVGQAIADKFKDALTYIDTHTDILSGINRILKGTGDVFDYFNIDSNDEIGIFFHKNFGKSKQLSISLRGRLNPDGLIEEYRPQINTCLAPDKCDHLLEILMGNKDFPLQKMQVYNLRNTQKNFSGIFIGISFMDQLIRVAQRISSPRTFNYTELIPIMQKELNENKLLYTKYKQGFIRAFTLYQIALNVQKNNNKPKHLYKLLIPDDIKFKNLWRNTLFFYKNTKIPYTATVLRKTRDLYFDFNKINFDIELIIKVMRLQLACWFDLNEKIKWISQINPMDSINQDLIGDIKSPPLIRQRAVCEEGACALAAANGSLTPSIIPKQSATSAIPRKLSTKSRTKKKLSARKSSARKSSVRKSRIKKKSSARKSSTKKSHT